AALEQEGPALVIDDDPGDAHGVRAFCAHVPRPSRLTRLSTVATTLAHSSSYLKEYAWRLYRAFSAASTRPVIVRSSGRSPTSCARPSTVGDSRKGRSCPPRLSWSSTTGSPG